MGSATEILSVILGAGSVGILTVIIKAFKDRAAGKTAREETAITRWRDLADAYKRESEKKSEVIAAYRRWYPRLWSAYQGKPGPKQYFPSDPSQPPDDVYDTLPNDQERSGQ